MFAALEKVNESENMNAVAWFMDELVKKGHGSVINTWKKCVPDILSTNGLVLDMDMLCQ